MRPIAGYEAQVMMKSGTEPVFLLTLVEHDLQSANGDGEQAETPCRQRCRVFCGRAEVGRVFHDAVGEKSDRMPTGMLRKKIQRQL